MNETTLTNQTIGAQAQYYDPSNLNQFNSGPYIVENPELADVKKEIMKMKLQTLKITDKIEDSQYKSILSMLASTDEKDLEMARLSIRTLWDEQL